MQKAAHFVRQIPSRLLDDPPRPAEPDPDLSRVISSWPTLPDHIRAAVLALIGTVNPPRGG